MNKPKHGLNELFNNEDLDEAVESADDTGMVAEQRQIVEEEMLLDEDDKPRP